MVPRPNAVAPNPLKKLQYILVDNMAYTRINAQSVARHSQE